MFETITTVYLKLQDQSQQEILRFLSSKITSWIALSNQYFHSRISTYLSPEEFVQKYFVNFEVFKMDAPVRTTAGVAKLIKSRFTKMAQTTEIGLNGKLCADLKVPSNLVEGCKTETFGFDGIKPIEELLKLGFDKIPKNAYALIIIDDRHVTR